MKNALLSNPKQPLNTTDYESNLVYNSINGASRETAMKIKHRILELVKLNPTEYRAIINSVLLEITMELQS